MNDNYNTKCVHIYESHPPVLLTFRDKYPLNYRYTTQYFHHTVTIVRLGCRYS